MYGFAAGISFIEDDPQIPAMREAWVRGYRKDAPEVQALAKNFFAHVSAEWGEGYMSRMS